MPTKRSSTQSSVCLSASLSLSLSLSLSRIDHYAGPEALERNVKATKEYIEKSSAKAQDYLDKTDPILLKKKTDPEQE